MISSFLCERVARAAFNADAAEVGRRQLICDEVLCRMLAYSKAGDGCLAHNVAVIEPLIGPREGKAVQHRQRLKDGAQSRTNRVHKVTQSVSAELQMLETFMPTNIRNHYVRQEATLRFVQARRDQ